MDDVNILRPQDIGANTCKHIVENIPGLRLPNLEKLGLMNSLGQEIGKMKKNPLATYGISDLAHSGADTFYGHQEIMGSRSLKPIEQPFSMSIDMVYKALILAGYRVKYVGNNIKFLLVNDSLTIADNIEADFGRVYNVTSALDLIDFKQVMEIGEIVRKTVKVSRVIAFGGEDVKMYDILSSVEEWDNKFIGINAPKSGVYKKGYKVIHMGYGFNPKVQIPTILNKAGINVTLIGKVADIVENENGRNIPCVDTEESMNLLLNELALLDSGLIAVNIQETDIAGHIQDIYKYAEKLIVIDKYIGEIIDKVENEDILLVTADHGNDPAIGHSHHTREKVPLLLFGRNIRNGYIGHRSTLSDIGATVSEYFNCDKPENGQSFLTQLL